MSRCSHFMLYFCAMNSEASQSSSFGWTGAPPSVPKSLEAWCRPEPKCHCQIRFTATRANNGFSGAVSQSANVSRRLRLPNGGLHLVRKNRQPFLVEPVVVRGDESTHFFDERPESRLVLLHRAALGEDFAGGGQVQPAQYERVKQRFHRIIIGLRD